MHNIEVRVTKETIWLDQNDGISHDIIHIDDIGQAHTLIFALLGAIQAWQGKSWLSLGEYLGVSLEVEENIF